MGATGGTCRPPNYSTRYTLSMHSNRTLMESSCQDYFCPHRKSERLPREQSRCFSRFTQFMEGQQIWGVSIFRIQAVWRHQHLAASSLHCIFALFKLQYPDYKAWSLLIHAKRFKYRFCVYFHLPIGHVSRFAIAEETTLPHGVLTGLRLIWVWHDHWVSCKDPARVLFGTVLDWDVDS